MKVAILTNGSYGDYTFCNDINSCNFVICADNGLHHAKNLGITPNFIIGDFDSVDNATLDEFRHIEIRRLNSIKDETDTECALDYAIEKGATEVIIYGGVGSRFDHSLANVHLLVKALDNRVKAELRNEHNTIYITDNYIEIRGKIDDLISLIPLTETVSGVDSTGLFYKLSNGSFKIGKPYGVSNYMTDYCATISLKSGKLLVIKTKD
ncbi:MAG: thiamine diphosphokinase [Epulopiscium sp. Nuni2H_MBin001]|nr:MAG: thiamine diphosphokinase [Epulopiscium sp. Nuni2H_MBin001]